MQRLMGFEGATVSTIFKGLQLDVGFPHQFLDVGYRLHGDDDGEFWLRSCGALLDVRPMGHEMTKGMCHDVEDPTFDATAVATNPRAQVRPIHRPPGVPKGGPDCHWTVTIRPDHLPVDPHPTVARMAATRLADLANEAEPGADPGPGGGWDDYAGPFDPHFELEDLSHAALQVVAREFAVQGHLLARSFMWSVEARHGVDRAVEVGRAIFAGVGRVTAERLVPVLDLDHDGPAAIARVLQVSHILLLRDYLGLEITLADPDTVLVVLRADSPARLEGDAFSVAGLLELGAVEILEALAQGVNPCAQVHDAAHPVGAVGAWTITIGDGEPAPDPGSVALVRLSHGADRVFLRRRPLRR